MMMMVKSHRCRLHLGDDDKEAAHPKEYRGRREKDRSQVAKSIFTNFACVFVQHSCTLERIGQHS